MDRLRVGTLNIWNRSDPWELRLEGIRDGLRTHDFDLLGLQEVLRAKDPTLGEGQATAIAEGRGYHVAFGTAWAEHGIELGNALLSRYPVVRSEHWPLPHAGGFAVGEDRRCLLLAEVEAPFGRIPVFVTHLAWKLHHGHVREQQVRMISDTVQRLYPVSSWTGYPPILLGDFNAEPESDEIRFLKGQCALGGKSTYFGDAWAIAGDGSKGATFARRNPFAAMVREPDRRIDYVFVRGPDKQSRGDVLSARVCFDRAHPPSGGEGTGVFPSDHFGVLADLSVGG